MRVSSNKLLHVLFLLCLFIGTRNLVHGQNTRTNAVLLPVQGFAMLTPPYSPYINALYETGGTKFLTTLTFKDLSETSVDVRFKLSITRNNTDVMVTKDNFYPLNRLTLTAGVPYNVAGEDWAEYFNVNNLVISASDRESIVDKGIFPEGFYTFSITVLDFNSGKELSNPITVSGNFVLGGIPQLIAPKANYMVPYAPQNIIFQWVMTAPPLFPENTEYVFKMYELTNPGVAPEVAVQNGNVVKMLESDPTARSMFVYDASAPSLEVGKKYVYYVKVQDKTGKSVFRNDGLSEPNWFVYGFPEGGKVPLKTPEDNYQYNLSDKQLFEWEVFDNKVIPTQPVSYRFKVVKLRSEDQDLAEALKINEPVYEETTKSSTSNTGWTTIVKDQFERDKWFAWKVEAYSGDQMVAQSELRKFKGAPLLDKFTVGVHEVVVKSTSNQDLTNLSGVGIVKLDAKGTTTAEIDFNNIHIVKKGNLYMLASGTLSKDISNGTPIEIPAVNKELRSVFYTPTAVKLDKTALYLKVDVAVPIDVVLDGATPQVIVKDKWVNYNSFYLRGGMSISGEFDLMEPLNFKITLDTLSSLIIGGTGYQVKYFGHVSLPDNSKNVDGKRIQVPFKNIERLKYFELDAEVMDLTFESYRPVENINLTVAPKKVICDFSDAASPGNFDKDWKGCYVSVFDLKQSTNLDKKAARVTYEVDYTKEVDLSVESKAKNWFTALGLQYLSDEDYKAGFKTKFNTFPCTPTVFKLQVENSVVKESEFRGRIKIPVIDDSRDFEVYAKISDNGFGEGFLADDLTNQRIYFSKEAPESKAELTIKRAVFSGNDHFDMTVDIAIPYIKVKVLNVADFKAYGDYQIGFGKRNGIAEFSEQVVGKYDNLFDLVFENFGTAYQGGRYVYYASTSVNLSQDATSATDGPVKVNIFGTQKTDESLGIQNDYSSAPVVAIPATVTELSPAKVPLVDSIEFKLDCGIAKLDGKVGIRKNDPEWGTCFNGKIKGVVYAPSEINCGSTIIIGKSPKGLDYWFFDIFMYDQGRGVPLVPGIVNIVGLEGRVFRHMSAKMDVSGKKAEIKIDETVKYGAGLYAQLIDAASNGQSIKADIGIEMKLLEGDFQLAIKGQATILNLEGRSASSAVTQKASSVAAKEVVAQAENELNSKSFKIGDWTFKPNIKSAEFRGGIDASNGGTKFGFGANVKSKSGYFNYEDPDWKVGIAGNKTPASFAFDFEKKTGEGAFGLSMAYLPGDSMGVSFKQGTFALGGAYYDTQKKFNFHMAYDQFKIGAGGSVKNKQFNLFLQTDANTRVYSDVNLIAKTGLIGAAFNGNELRLGYTATGDATIKYNNILEALFNKEEKKASFMLDIDNNKFSINGSPKGGGFSFVNSEYTIGANVNLVAKSGGLSFINGSKKYQIDVNTLKKTGLIVIEDGGYKFKLGTGEDKGSGVLGIGWGTNDFLLNANLIKKEGSISFKAGKDNFLAALTADSALISTSISGVSIYASGHKSGRGGISYAQGTNEVKLFGDKTGKGNVLVKSGGMLFNVAADKTTGSGLIRYKMNNDSVYLFADRSLGMANIATKFGDNTFQLGYNAAGRGNLRVQAADNIFALEGDKAGSGNILFSKPGFLIETGANIVNKSGKVRLQIENDSIGAYFSAAEGGRVNAAFGNNSFSGNANPSGKGNLAIKVGTTVLSGAADPEGLNSIFFKDGDIYLSTGLNKVLQSGYFGFRKANDSINATIDKLNKKYTFQTAFSGNAFSGAYTDGKSGSLAINAGGIALGISAEKAGIGTFDFAMDNTKAHFYGDRTTGNADVSFRLGKDSLMTKVIDGKKFTGAMAFGDFAMSYNYAPEEDQFYKYENGNTLLYGYNNLNGNKGGRFRMDKTNIRIEAGNGGKGIVGIRYDKDSLLLGINDGGKNYLNAKFGDYSLVSNYIKDGDKSILFNSPQFNLEASQSTAEKMVDLKIGTDKRIRLSSTKYAYLNINKHEFKMDATKPNKALLYIDGREIEYNATENKDSVNLGYKGDGATFFVAAHRQGRGYLSFDKGDNKLNLFADKAGAGRISAQSGTTLFDISGNKGTGNGALRLLLGADSLNILADRSKGIARLGTKFGENSMYAAYNAEGFGNISLTANGNYIALGGDASGSGDILFQNKNILAAAAADIKTTSGKIRFKMDNDSINAFFNGTAGNAGLTSAFAGNAFSGAADKSGKGNVNFITSEVQLNATLDPEALSKIYFHKGELTFAAQNNKASKYSNIRFKLSNDSVAAFADRATNSYGFETAISGTSLAARLDNGSVAKLDFSKDDIKLNVRAAKAGNGAISYNDNNNAFFLEGDRTSGNAAFRLRPGTDSLSGAVKDGKIVSGAFAISNNTMAFNYGEGQNNFFKFQTGDNKLNAFFNADKSIGAGFENKDVNVRLYNQGAKGLAALRMGKDSINAIINDNGNYSFAAAYDGRSLITNYNKTADKNIKLTSPEFNLTAGQFGEEKMVDFAFDNKRLKISSTKFVQLNANSHEFKMDATNAAANPKFFIDGSEIAYEFNKDSVNLGWSGDDKIFQVMAHRLGRGKVRFKLGENDVALFANKELGSAGVKLKFAQNLFELEGNKTTGSGFLNIALGADSVNVMADRAAGIASINTNVNGNSLKARYDATGKGFLNFAQGTDNKIELSGDASGSGSIYLQKGNNIIAANADINTQIGGFRLRSGSDSVNTSYNGTLGLASVATAFDGVSFSGNAYKSGKGNLDLSLTNLRLKANADENLNSIYFKKDNFLIAASNDKVANKGNFRLKFDNDSLNAYVDGTTSSAGFKTSVSNVALSGEMTDGIKGNLGVKFGTTELYAAAAKQGSGTFTYADANNRFKIFGDKTTGEGNLALRFGSDSLQAAVAPNFYTGALSIGDVNMSYQHAPGKNSFYKFATTGVSLNGFMNPDNSKGVRFASAGNVVRLENAGTKGLISYRKDADSLNIVVNDAGKHSFIGSLNNTYIETSYLKDGDKTLKFNTQGYGFAAAYGTTEKAIDLTFDNKRINVSSKKFVLLQANNHEFKMDATNAAANPKFFIDGNEVQYEVGNKDSISLGWAGGNDAFNVYAHRVGRGGLRFKKGDNDVSFFADKAGAGKISVSTGTNAFMIAGNKNTGYGAMRFKVGSDSINVLSDDASGVRKIATSYSGNSLFAGFENGIGTVGMNAAGTKINLKGDLEGNGNIFFQTGDILAAASADIGLKLGTMRFKTGNDSINTAFNGNEGSANVTASFGGTSFRGAADKSGKGDLKLITNGLNLVGQADPAGINAISFKKDAFLFAASNDNKLQINSFRLKNGNDSLNAYVNKQTNVSAFSTAVNGTYLGARLEDGSRGVLSIGSGDLKMDFSAEKANAARLNLVNGDTRFRAYGDKTSGDIDLGLQMGKDSLTVSALSGNYKGAFVLGDKTMNFAAVDANNNSFNYKDATTKLSTYANPEVGKGISFATGDILFNLENLSGDKGLFKFRKGVDSIYSFINDNGKHTFSANYAGVAFNTEYKKVGDKYIKIQGTDFLVEASEKATDKFINLKYKNNAIKVDNKRKASFNAGAHEFLMDASVAETPKLFIDGKEFAFDATQLFNKDSIGLGLTVDNYKVFAAAHTAGRGQFNFKSSSDELGIWGNKSGYNRIFLNTSGALIDLGGYPTTGEGLLRVKLNNDSINLKANPAANSGAIAAAYGNNAFAGAYDGQGKGSVSLQTGSDLVAINGDASGSGAIKLRQGDLSIASNADINAKKAAFSFSNTKDSITTAFDGTLGTASVNAAFGDNTFSADGNKEGLANLAIATNGLQLAAGLNPKGINFINYKQNDFGYKAYINKADQLYNFAFRIKDDSLSANLDKQLGLASFKSYLAGNELSGFINAVGRANFTLNNADFFLNLMAQKQGTGTIRYSGTNGSGDFYGDVTSGLFNLKSRWGKDSMFVFAENNKPFTGGFAAASTGLAFQLNGAKGHYFTFVSAEANLDIIKGIADKDASLNYKYGTTKVRLLSTAQDKAEFAVTVGEDSVSAKLNETAGSHSFNASILKNNLSTTFVKDGDKKMIFNGSGYSIENVYSVNALKYAKFTRNGVGVKVSSDKKILVTTGTHEVLLTVSTSNEPELYIDGVKQKFNPNVKFTIDGIDFTPNMNLDLTMFDINLPNFPAINVGFTGIGLPSFKCTLPNLPSVNMDFVHLPNGFSFDFDGRFFSFDANMFKLNLPSFNYNLDFSTPNLDFGFKLPAVDFKWNGFGDFNIDFTNNFRFELTKDYAKALYFDKYLMLDKNLLAKLSYDANKYVTYQINASAPKTLGKITMKFDDLIGEFEKDKTLALKYQNASINLNPSSGALAYNDKSINYEVTKKSLTLKNGASNTITLEPTKVSTTWEGYTTALGADSLSFAKDDAILNLSTTAVKIAKAGKSIRANKTNLDLNYDANTYVSAAFDKVNAKWNDASISYAQGEPLAITYLKNTFALNKIGMKVANDDKSLSYIFASKALSMKVAADSFSVSPEKFAGVYKNYKLDFSKTAGMNYEDGTRKVALSKDNILASQNDLKLTYATALNEITIQKGDNYSILGAPGKVGVVFDQTKVGFTSVNGVKTLEVEIPGFKKITAGIDAQNLAFLGGIAQINELPGGFAVGFDDKNISYTPDALKINVGKDIALNYGDKKFDIAYPDFKAFYNSAQDFGATYKDAVVSITPALKQLAYGNKSISLNDKNELKLLISETRTIALGLAGTANVVFDDVKFDFEKNKLLSVAYKKDFKFNVDAKGINTEYEDNSLAYEVGTALTLKQGKQNQITITPSNLVTQWAGYNFSVGKDSLGFNKDGAAVSVSEKGIRVMQDGKSLVYTSDKKLKLFYDANKYVEASTENFNAKWDDAAIAYGKGTALQIAYKANSFVLNKTGLRLTDGARAIAYNFNQSASYRQGTDSFMVSKETVFAQYQNYKFSFSKTEGLSYNDGSRSALVNGEKVAINIDDVMMAYDAAKTEVRFRKGSENELVATPEGASLMMEGIKIAYFNDNGAKKLEFDVPNYAKIYGGFDPKGGNFISFSKDNTTVAFTEKDGGYELSAGDKMIFASPKELRFNYSSKYNFKVTENDFAMTMGDMKAYYGGIAKMGMEYQQAKFDVTADLAKLTIGEKYLSIDKDNNLRLQLQDTRYITANPLAMKVVFDDVLASVEKDKQVLLKYKEDNSLSLTDKGIQVSAGSRSLDFVVGESITVNDGSNRLMIGKKGLATNWAGYNFSLNEDSLSFTKDGAVVKASPTGARVAYDGKSLRYEHGKALELYLSDTKHLTASPEAINATWEDAAMSYGKNEPLKLSYLQNSFTLAKTALQLANGDNVLTYKFDQTISFRMKSDSFMVNKESVTAKYSNYNFALSKAKGLSYSDGSRSADVSGDKIAIKVEDVSMYYDATKTEVGFQKGSENALTASPEGASITMEGIKIAYFRDNGAHKLEFDVPKFAKIYGGFDPKGGNFFRFNKDNIDFSITEKDGGYEFISGDKLVAYGPQSITARYGKSAYLNLKGTTFDMQYNDLKANYASPTNMGMSYGDAAFVVNGEEGKLSYQNYLLALNASTKTLRAQLSADRYLEATAAGKVDFKYDDILASFEKDKSLMVAYKNEHSVKVTAAGAELISGDKSLVYEAEKSITVKVGASNFAKITPDNLSTTWSGYSFSVGKDSLGFDAEGAKVAITATTALASYGGKSLAYESGKSLKFFYEANKFVEASPIACSAKWDDVNLSYAKNEALKVSYQKNEFTLNKTALSLADGNGRVLKYQFNKTISVRMDADSFMVNPEMFTAKYQKYNLAFSKAKGLAYSDGSRSLNVDSSKIALSVDDVSMSYDSKLTEIRFKRGADQELVATPTKSTLKLEGVTIAYFRNNGSHELSFDVPSFATVAAGFDPNGKSMFSFAKDNIAFSIFEKNGGVEFKTMDKIAFIAPTEFKLQYSADMFVQYVGNDFNMQMQDFKGYFKAKDNFGLTYKDAKFIVDPTFARLAYGEKYISLDNQKTLRVQYDDKKYLTANPTKLNFNYDDVAFNFEKNKELAMSYKEDHYLKVTAEGLEAGTGDKSLGINFTNKSLLIKEGALNSVAASQAGMLVDWASYKFAVSADSLGFIKDGASVSAARSGLRVAYQEKSLKYTTATKEFQVNYEAKKYVTLSPDAVGARWDDMGVDFSPKTSLSMFVKDKRFAINKDYISLAEADAYLAYRFVGALSIRYKTDSLFVSKEKISGKLDKYTMSVSKADGAILSDGVQTYRLKDKAEITYQGYTASYDLNTKAIGFKKGTEWGFYGSPLTLGFNVDNVKIDLGKETGISYEDGNNTFKFGDDLIIKAKQLNNLSIGIKGLKTDKRAYYMQYDKYGVAYEGADGFKFNYDKNWFSVGGDKKYFATHWDDLDIEVAEGKIAASKAGYGLVYGGDLYFGVLSPGSEITLTKQMVLGLKDKIQNKGVEIGADGIVTLINGDQRIIAGGNQPITFADTKSGMSSPSDASSDEMKFSVVGMDLVVKPADGNNLVITTKVKGIDIDLTTSGEGTMKATVAKDGKKYATIYKNFYSWGLSLGDQNADTDGPKVEEPVKMDGPANIGYITQNSTSVLQVVLYASYSSKTKTFVLNGQATGTQPLLCTRNVTLAAKFSPDDWYIKVADKPRAKWASVKPLCLFVETSGYFYVDESTIEAGLNYGYHFDVNTGWITIIPEVFKAKVGAYFDFDIGGEGKIQMKPKFAIPYIRIWLDARAGIYGCVDIFGGGGGCVTLVEVRISGELVLVITDAEKSAAGKIAAGVTICGKSFDAEFQAKVNF